MLCCSSSPIGGTRLRAALPLAAAALLALATNPRRPARAAALLALGSVLAWAVAGPLGALRMSPYKELSQTLQVMGTRVLAQTSSPLGVITVVASPEVPLRQAPGLSLSAPGEPPEQLGMFTDGEGMSAITRYDGRREPLVYLDYVTSAAGYHLLAQPRVLVLGAGAGGDVLQALYHAASSVDAVELNPDAVELVQQSFGEFSGRPYAWPGVQVHVGEARGFVAATRSRYDLIQIALIDAFGASSAGLYALAESYLYTVESLQACLGRLAPGATCRSHAGSRCHRAERSSWPAWPRWPSSAAALPIPQAPCAAARLEHRHAAGQERRFHPRGYRAAQGLQPLALLRPRLVSRHPPG